MTEIETNITNVQDEQLDHDDMDRDIRQKQDLIAEIKQVTETTKGEEAVRQVNNLKKQWRRIHYWESSFEDDLEKEFDSYADTVYASREEMRSAAKERKEALIERARELAQTNDFRNAAAGMDELMEEWKQAGAAGKPADDELWHQFQEARKSFYERRRANYRDRLEQFEKVKEVKENLIEEARKNLEPDNWNKATTRMDDLMKRWKEAGFAGRENEPALWETFNGIRKEFYAKRSKYFEEVHAQQKHSLELKKGIIQEAADILESQDFSRENIDRMKALSGEWKQAGFSGRQLDDAVWKEFRAVCDQFFDQLKAERDQRHQNWVERMEDTKDRKRELISEQQRRIRRMEDELNGLISQARAEQIEDMIAEKEDFIERLEKEIAEIDEKLAN